MTAPLLTPAEVEGMRERHVRWVDHKGHAWCRECDTTSWPCDAARLLALVKTQETSLRSLDHFAEVAETCERKSNTYAARLAAVLAECDTADKRAQAQVDRVTHGTGRAAPRATGRVKTNRIRRAAAGETT